MLTIYLRTKIKIFKNFADSYQSTSNLAKDISLEWCPNADFEEAESLSNTGWQSA
jgi:hypothetical protein